MFAGDCSQAGCEDAFCSQDLICCLCIAPPCNTNDVTLRGDASTQVKTVQETLRSLPLVADADALEVLMEDDELLIVSKPAGAQVRLRC